MRLLIGWVVALTVSLGVVTPVVHAEPALRVQPLQYRESLAPGERKKAHVDITNPAPQTVTVSLTVEGFKQIDDKGTLSFYADERLRSGIVLDFDQVEIPAYKTLRLYFVADGTKLPTGDIFAVIFAQTKPDAAVATPSVRVGTLLMLTNGSPGARQAVITSLNAPFVQFGDGIRGEVTVTNTAPAKSASGFFPTVTYSTWPFGPSGAIEGPLLYAGNSRVVTLDRPSSQFGLYKLQVSYGDSSKEQWVMLVTGIWQWLVFVLLGVLAALVAASVWWVRRRRARRSS